MSRLVGVSLWTLLLVTNSEAWFDNADDKVFSLDSCQSSPATPSHQQGKGKDARSIRLCPSWQWRMLNDSEAVIHSCPPVPAFVPGQVHADLQNAGVIGDPLHGFNDVKFRWVALSDWELTTTINVSDIRRFDTGDVLLEFDGIDTVATVYVGTVKVLQADNMFAQHSISLSNLSAEHIHVSVHFHSAPRIAEQRHREFELDPANRQRFPQGLVPESAPSVQKSFNSVQFLRKQPASFGWDWGPGLATMGLWKSVRIVARHQSVVTLRGSPLFFPSPTLQQDDVAEEETVWRCRIRLPIVSSRGSDAEPSTLHVDVKISSLVEQATPLVDVQRNAQFSPCGLYLDVDSFTVSGVRRWWPHGLGDQTLYRLNVTLRHSTARVGSAGAVVGFRTVELDQTADDPAQGSQGPTAFRFRVNEQLLFIKGANWVPPDSLASRVSPAKMRSLFDQYKRQHLNMLRLWGGGDYGSDEVYDLCDEYGFLVWEEAAFACATYPDDAAYLRSVREEVRQNYERVYSHASLAIVGGNNENAGWINMVTKGQSSVADYIDAYRRLYLDTIKQAIVAVWPGYAAAFVSSSPSNGNETADDPVARNPYASEKGDIHFYNYGGDCWDWERLYPRARFVSEYGYLAWASWTTLRTVYPGTPSGPWTQDLWARHRNHANSFPGAFDAVSQWIDGHYPTPAGAHNLSLRDAVYLSQVAQAYCLKMETEAYMAYAPYTMGVLYWQANDNWPTISWSTVDYAARPKLSHFLLSASFHPQAVRFTVSHLNATVCISFSSAQGQATAAVGNLLTGSIAKLPRPGRTTTEAHRSEGCFSMAAVLNIAKCSTRIECVLLDTADPNNFKFLGAPSDSLATLSQRLPSFVVALNYHASVGGQLWLIASVIHRSTDRQDDDSGSDGVPVPIALFVWIECQEASSRSAELTPCQCPDITANGFALAPTIPVTVGGVAPSDEGAACTEFEVRSLFHATPTFVTASLPSRHRGRSVSDDTAVV